MEEANKPKMEDCFKRGRGGHHGAWGGAYGLAALGAAVYYIQTTAGFWPGVLGVLKAIVWPAFLMHRVFELIKM